MTSQATLTNTVTYQRLPVVSCVGAWVVTEWSVSCLGNSQAITKSCPKFVKFPPYQLLPVVTCVGAWVITKWLVSCLGNSQVITKSCLNLVNLLPISCFMVTCELPRQETEPTVTTHTPTQVTTGSS